MKILHVSYIFPPKAEVADGITRVVYGLTRALAKKGNDVTVYASNALDLHGKARIEIENSPAYIDGVKVRYFPYLLRYGTIFFTPSIFYSIRDDIKKFDVIHIHDARCLQCAIATYHAGLFNIPIVFQPHGSFKSPFPSGRLRKHSRICIDKLYAEKVFKKVSKIVVLSHVEAEQYKAMGVPEERIAIIPNGIDLSEYADLPPKGAFKKKFNIDENEKVVLYLGRIHASKGLGLLADAFSVVCKDLNNVRLVVVGPDDGYAATFSRRISHLGIGEKVLLTGFVEKRDKLAALVDSEVFVTPRFYGFPVTFLEACLAGCPIVTTTDELDWIHNNVGYVVENSPVALAKATSKILQHERTLKRFQNNCRHTIKNFDISTVVSQLEDTYKSVVRRTAG